MIRFADEKDAEIVGRCVRPLCFAAQGDEHYGLPMFEIDNVLKVSARNIQLGLQGSCTLILYRDKFFALFTRHQIAKIPNETLADLQARLNLIFVLMDDGRNSMSLPIGDLVFSFDHGNEEDEDDFVVAVIEASMITNFMRAQFFPVSRNRAGMRNDDAIGAGFPSNYQQVLMEKDGLRLQLSCRSGVVTHRLTRSTAILKYDNDGDLMDGYSGGPVFVVRREPIYGIMQDMITFVDGIIQRGGNGHLRYLTIERILDKIDERVFL